MNTSKKLQEIKIDIKLKLALLWVSFMFLYIYVDYFALYMPNKIADIQKGKVFVFDITQQFIFLALALATIPIIMIFLSVVLKAKVNRLVNIIVAVIHIPYMLFNLAGEFWGHMIFAAIIEVILLFLIIYFAWNWPQTETLKITQK